MKKIFFKLILLVSIVSLSFMACTKFDYTKNIQIISNELKVLKDSTDSLKSLLAKNNDIIKSLQKSNDSLAIVLNNTVNILKQVDSSNTTLYKSLDSLISQITIINNQILVLNNQITTTNSNITSTSNQLLALTKQYTDLLSQFNLISSQLNTIPQISIINGLVAYFPFNGNANDSSGNGNNGIVTNAILTTDRFGKPNSAYNFDGNGDYINCGNKSILNLTGAISISVWVLANNFNTDHGVISKMNASTTSPYGLVTNNNRMRWDIGNEFIFSNTINSGQWINIISTYDPKTLVKNLYVNGVLSSNGIATKTSIPVNTDNLYIGAHQPSKLTTWSWDGKIDEVRIYNRVLNSTEIAYLSSN